MTGSASIGVCWIMEESPYIFGAQFSMKIWEWLRANRYDLYQFQCKSLHSAEDLHQDFKRTLQFPEYYGQNFDALDECTSDLSVPEEGGMAIVLQSFDAYAKGLPVVTRAHSSRTDAEVLLDILATASRRHLLYGRRFLTLV